MEDAAKALYLAVITDRKAYNLPAWDETSEAIRGLYRHYAKATIDGYHASNK